MIWLTEIPSPTLAVWHLGPLPIRAYALAIMLGIIVAALLAVRRWRERGGDPSIMVDICMWAVPFGIVGGRIYHVITTPELYFGTSGNLLKALAIWEGGLGIWGAIAFGAVGAYIGARRAEVLFPPVADTIAPTLLVAQAIGRLGNYFNQELFGGPTELPWGLTVDSAHTPAGYVVGQSFHPTFLYELLWNLVGAAVIIWLDRRMRLGHGRVFCLYVMVYTLGRGLIEMVRIDYSHHILGLRLNVWTALLLGIAALVGFIIIGRSHPGREQSLFRPGHDPRQAEVAPLDSPADSVESVGLSASTDDLAQADIEAEADMTPNA